MASSKPITSSLTRSLTRKLTGEELNRLFLEKFKLTLGDEMAVNGSFEADSDWIAFGVSDTQERSTTKKHSGTYSWYIDASAHRLGIMSPNNFSVTVGKTYTVSMWIYATDGAEILAGLNNTDQGVFTARAVTQNQWTYVTYNATANATGASYVNALTSSSTQNFYVDDVSVKEITKQAPLAAFSLRKLGDVSPYAARIRRSSDNTEAQVMFDASDRVSESSVVRNTSHNLLSYSEDFGKWTLGTTPERIGGLEDPFGGNNAWSLKSTTAAYHNISLSGITITANSTHTFSWYVKKEATRTNFGGVALNLTGGTSKWAHIAVDETNGTATSFETTTNTPHISITEPITGWYRVAVTLRDTHSNTSAGMYFYSGFSSNGTSLSSVTGSARTIFGAQLERTLYESTPSGSELVSNGTFDSETGWTFSTSWTIANGKASWDDTGVGSMNTTVALNNGKTYILTFDVVEGTTPYIFIGNTAGSVSYDGQSYQTRNIGSHSITFTMASAQTTLAFYASTSGTTFSIDNVSVKELLPELSEYISTPVVSNDGLTFTESTLDTFVGGENLIRKSEEFSSNWVNNNLTLTADTSVTDPNGGTGAYKCVKTGGGAYQRVYDSAKDASGANLTGGAGDTYTCSVYVKPTGTTVGLRLTATGTTSAYDDITVTPNVWQRVSFSHTTTGAYTGVTFFLYPCGTGADSDSTTGGDAHIFGAQVNTNSLKTYQATTGTARAGDASIVTLYNQTGGEDAVQSNTSYQPLLYNAGLLVRSGTSPAIEFINSNPYHNLELFGQIQAAHLDAFFVHDTSDTTYSYPNNYLDGSDFGLVSQDGNTGNGLLSNYGNPTLYANGTSLGVNGASLTRDGVHNSLNGRKLVHHQGADTSDWSKLMMGWYGNGVATGSHLTFGFTGKFAEMVFFDSNQSSNKTAIESDINDFHNIY